MTTPELRPLAIGEILDVSVKVYRENFATLVKAVAIVIAPVYLLSAIVQISARPDPGHTVAFGTALGASIVVSVLSLIAGQIATGSAFKAVGEAYLGQKPDVERSIRFAISKIGPLIWASILFGIAVGIGFLLCLAPGIYLLIAFSLFTPVVLLEDVRGTKALTRSRELVKGRWWSILGVFVLAYILIFVFSAIIGAVFGAVISGAGGNGVAAIILSFLINTISGSLTTPFLAAVVTVTYFDERVRKEGFDIQLLTERFGIDPPPASSGGYSL